MDISILSIVLTFWTILSGLFVVPLSFRFAGRLIGSSLKRKSALRRKILLAKVEAEQDDYRAKKQRSSNGEDEDWEKVETYAAGTARNGESGEDDWNGVVGFFHPFW